MFGSDIDEKDEQSAIYHNFELDLLRLTQRVTQLEKTLPSEV